MPLTAAELANIKNNITPKQLDALVPTGARIIRPLPDSTPISKMGLSAATVAKLSPQAQKLTKGDLVALWNNKTSPLVAAVKIEDLNTIKGGFATQIGKGPGTLATDIYCCCCPCCCATAVVEPVPTVA